MSTNIGKYKLTQKYYGQLVLGPPGAGKTTYCSQMSQLLKKLGRSVIIVNLDPANDFLSYEPDVDVRELVNLENVMKKCNLGPNGGLLFCMEYLEENIDWLLEQINQFKTDNSTNFIFDLPGQAELYGHHDSMSNIFHTLANKANLQLCVVHLIDSHHCSDAGKFISALMLSLNGMLKVGLPYINLLSKVDLLKKHKDKLHFGIDFYTEVLDLSYLLDCLDTDKVTSKYKKLNAALISVIEDYSLVTFQLVSVKQEKSLLNVKKLVDKANGYVFKSDEGRHINSMLACAMGVTDDSINHELQ